MLFELLHVVCCLFGSVIRRGFFDEVSVACSCVVDTVDKCCLVLLVGWLIVLLVDVWCCLALV